MSKHLRYMGFIRLLLIAASLFCFTHNPALLWALPDEQVQQMVRTDPLFAFVEKALLNNWKATPKQYKNMYRPSYLEWIKTNRDKRAANLMREGLSFNEAYTVETALFNNTLRGVLPPAVQRRLYYIDMPELYALMAEARKRKSNRGQYVPPPASTPTTPQVSTGTGFFISNDGGVVTNYHVIQNMRTIKVYDPKYNIWSDAEVMRFDKDNDVALLWAKRRGKALPLTSRFNMRKGEQIFTLGYPSPGLQGAQQKATFGRINANMGIADDVRYFQIDSPIQPGNSGGPVFNEAGEVVGIVTSRLVGDYQNVNYALKIDYLFPLIATVFPDIDKYDNPNAKPEPGTLPQLVERYEDSVVMIVAE